MSYFDVFCYCLRKKKFFAIPFIIALLCFFLAWILPPVFKTEIRLKIDASSDSSPMSALSTAYKSLTSSGASGLSSFLSSSKAMKPSDLYLEILSGREIALSTIHKFHLDTMYKKESNELLLKKFDKDIKIDEDQSGVISCAMESKHKVMARDIVRYMVAQSNEKYLKLQRENLQYSLDYLKKSQRELTDSVRNIGQELVQFYRDNNLVDLKSQMELTLTVLGGYEGQINNFKLSERMSGKDNADAHEMRKKRQLLEQKFRELRGSYSENYKPSDKSMYINSGWAVSKMLYEQQRQADLKLYATMLEAASIEIMETEAMILKTQPVIQIIQDAYLPDWKERPKRAKWAIAGFAVSLTLTLLFIILRGLLSGEIPNSEPVREKLLQIKTSLFK
ncbi:MAG: hypothetical protein IK012_09945 [Fibrobacter sp.]|uniref:hypothetical protein n=1 Tax=Fibrobacter sp. TaxID=35828 RepID=UPI0025C29650|nr:hypothetical protein [Fibrobacter sp.]MBR4785553.1 hypothetical protein [Fibrobacter sp.]